MHLHDGFFVSSSPKFLPISSQISSNRGILKHCKDFGIMDVSRHPSNEWKNGVVSFRPPTVLGKQMSTYPARDHLHHKKPFSLKRPQSRNSIWSGKKQVEMENSLESSHEILRPGMLLLKNYLSLSEQVELVNKCEELGVGPGGFYEPYPGGAKLRRLLLCLGRNWDPQTKYNERFRSDGSEAPPMPDEFIQMVKNIFQFSQSLIKSEYELPLMSPDICLINFYTTIGRLALHQDRDERPYSLRVGLPVVSISIGDSADFLYGFNREVDDATNILLESGDVLIFGGKSRLIYHGVKTIILNSAPRPLLKQTMLRPGRLNLTFREF